MSYLEEVCKCIFLSNIICFYTLLFLDWVPGSWSQWLNKGDVLVQQV